MQGGEAEQMVEADFVLGSGKEVFLIDASQEQVRRSLYKGQKGSPLLCSQIIRAPSLPGAAAFQGVRDPCMGSFQSEMPRPKEPPRSSRGFPFQLTTL